MARSWMRGMSVVLGALSVASHGFDAMAQQARAPTPPDLVKQPTGLDLGGTSFYDGFGTLRPGFIFFNYESFERLNAITAENGSPSSVFNKPSISVFASIYQLAYVSPIHVLNGVLGVNGVLPVVNFDTHFKTPGLVLHDNGLNIGNLTFGPFYQSAPVLDGHRPIFQFRAELDTIFPTGGFDSREDINQGSGFYSFTPYLAATAVPVPGWEITGRAYYVYNFETDRIADPPIIPGFTPRNGQAGQSAFINFDSSYEIMPGVAPGINGFYFKQFTEDRINGTRLDGTLEEQLYVGPGIHFDLHPRSDFLNLNVYIPIEVRNTTSGAQFNLQYVHVF